METALQQSGPVHLNLPLEEPLYDTTSEKIPLPGVKTDKAVPQIEESKLKSLSELWHKHTKKWVIVGVLSPHSIEQKWVEALCEDPSVVVFTYESGKFRLYVGAGITSESQPEKEWEETQRKALTIAKVL